MSGTAKAPFARYDDDADVLWIQLRDGAVSSRKELDDYRLVEYDADGRLLAIEIVEARQFGVDLGHIDDADALTSVLQAAGLNFRIYA